MRLMDICVRQDFGEVWVCIVGHYCFAALAYISKKLVVIDNSVAEMIGHPFHRKLIKHGQAATEYEALNIIL